MAGRTQIATFALICVWLAGCASAPSPDETARLCAVLDAVTAQRDVTAHLNAAQDRRLRTIPRGDLADDVICGTTIYRHAQRQGLSYIGVGFDASGRFAAVQTHTSDGQYFVAGDRCLFRRRGRVWQKLGCSLQYIS